MNESRDEHIRTMSLNRVCFLQKLQEGDIERETCLKLKTCRRLNVEKKLTV
jgi:hypothetical protein